MFNLVSNVYLQINIYFLIFGEIYQHFTFSVDKSSMEKDPKII